jgi:hypothetical protein
MSEREGNDVDRGSPRPTPLDEPRLRKVLHREAHRVARPIAAELVDGVRDTILRLREQYLALRDAPPEHFHAEVVDERPHEEVRRRARYAL